MSSAPAPATGAGIGSEQIDGPGDPLRVAEEQGRVCALAAAGARDLRDRAEAYPELFPPGPFDPTLFSTVSLATAFGAPWCDRDELRTANRAALWIFAADWLIDHRAQSRAEIDAVTERCLLVADGAAPADTDPLGRFLAEIRDGLRDATPSAFDAHRTAWREEFRRMLHAMATEWSWKQRLGDGDRPDLDSYLSNADNFGSSFVNVSHWIRTGAPATLAHLSELTTVGRRVQQVLRLVNDLATHQRDERWGDLNALMLGVDRPAVAERIAQLVGECRAAFATLPPPCRSQADYLGRQIGFSTGFYRLTDFWGGS